MNNQDEYVQVAYKSSTEEIRFFKRQQWIVTNYTVLLYGAIIWLSNVLSCPFLFWGIIVVGIAAIILIWLLQNSTDKVRDRLEEIKNKTPSTLKSLFFEEKVKQGFLDRYCVIGFLLLVILAGGVLSFFAVLKITRSTIYVSMINYISVSSVTINSIGLFFGFVGSISLLIFWMPFQIALPGKVATDIGSYTEQDKKKIRRMFKFAKLGFILLIIGFLVQIISNHIFRDY